MFERLFVEYFEIHGGKVVSGEIVTSGNKNEALPVIAAALLSTGTVILDNVPDILDVRNMLEIASDLGVSVTKINKNKIEINALVVRLF